jgi:hypothetical protein
MDECRKFKKPGGGRGKPARDSLCANCGVIWHQHFPRVIKPKSKNKIVIDVEEIDADIIAPKPIKTSETDPPPIDPPIEDERSPEDVARISAWLAQNIKENFGEDCPTINDW